MHRFTEPDRSDATRRGRPRPARPVSVGRSDLNARSLVCCDVVSQYASRARQWQFIAPLPRKIRKVGAPLGVIIALGTLAGLIVILLTAANPVGTAIGFVLSSVAMTVVLLAYLWLDRWEPEPPRLLVLAFLWGASVAVLVSVSLELYVGSVVAPAATRGSGQFRLTSRLAHRSSKRRPRVCFC